MPDSPNTYSAKELRPYLFASIGLLASGGVLGAIASQYVPGVANYFEANIAGFTRLFRSLSPLQLAAAIFLNNALKAFMVIIGGLALGTIPVIFLLVNGAALGFVLAHAALGRGLGAALVAILPHGIFEITAILLATSSGLWLARAVANKIFGNREASVSMEFARALKLFLRVVVPLLAFAAIVEAFVTAALVAR
jgi:stage II sporulation protein M